MALQYRPIKDRVGSIVTKHMTEDMVKTTARYCADCKYEWGKYGEHVICGYYSDTGKHRGCPQGYCNKKEKKDGTLRNNNLRYSIKNYLIMKEDDDEEKID